MTPAPTAAAPAATPTPAPGETATPQGGEEATPEASASPSPTGTPDAGAGLAQNADLVEWPQGKTAWTIVINSSGTREDAERLAKEVAGKGVPGVGVLDSNDFESLGPDSFVVFAGQFPSQDTADAVLSQVKDRAGGGSTRKIVPKEK